MTFSIIARETAADGTVAFGMAVSSSSPAVAARCLHLRSGVGVVASQNITDPRFGPFLLDRLADGRSAAEALADLGNGDDTLDYRQLSVLGATGAPVTRSGPHTLGTHTAAVGEDAVCEYLPGQNTLFAGSRLLQVTDVSLANSATLLAADVILTGRLARGERDLFDALGQCWRVERCGRPLLSDTLCVVGAGAGRSEMLLSRWPVWGTVLIVPPVAPVAPVALVVPTPLDNPTSPTGASPVSVKELLASLRELLVELTTASPSTTDPADLTAVASTMVGDAGITVRVAGEDPVAVRAIVDAVHDHARRALLGRPAVDLRRM